MSNKAPNQETKAASPTQEILNRIPRWWKQTGIQAGKEGADKDLVSLLESANAEHAALVAVAEAAENAEIILDAMDLRPAHQCTATQLRVALANLAAVREGKI